MDGCRFLQGFPPPRKRPVIMEMLRDLEIRTALRTALRAMHADEPNTAIIDELSLCQGEARVDVAVVNGALCGYEIKSDRDSLARLPRQLSVYELCFDTMVIVVGSRHVESCFASVPESWGIWEATAMESEIKFEIRRSPANNHRIDAKSVVKLLWKEEVFESLKELGHTPSPKAERRALWEHLVLSVEPNQLFHIVRERLRARGDWRSAPTPFRCGGSSRSVAKSQRFQENRRWLLSTGSHRPQH